MTYQLRPYQNEAVSCILNTISTQEQGSHHVAVLGTGAGKSLIIAETIKKLDKKVLVLCRNKEICAQNATKYTELTGNLPSIYNAGLNSKSLHMQAVFASAQSLANLDERAYPKFDLVIIDECHQWGLEDDSATIQSKKIVGICQKTNPTVPVIGLTATPYRLKSSKESGGYINKLIYGQKDSFFKKCLINIPEEKLTAEGYLAPIEFGSASRMVFYWQWCSNQRL